jgi:glycosyltransferase involved in cell wall biosynthesis
MAADETMTADPPGWRVLDDGRSMGGGQRFALRLARYLAQSRPAPVVRFACPPSTALAEACERECLPWTPVRFPAPWHAPGLAVAALRVRRLMARAPDGEVVVGNTARTQAAAVLGAAALRHPPALVHLMHEQDTADRVVARWVHRRVGAVVAVGANAAAAYERAMPGVPVLKLNNFLAPGELERLAGLRDAPRGGAPVLAVLARLIPEKGVLELVEDLAQVPVAWSELRIAGDRQDAAYAARVESRAAELGLEGRVALLGHLEDVPALLGQADALVVPSVGNEGQPTAILEALGIGVPVLVRPAVHSADYAGLPVLPYDGPGELATSLGSLPARPAPVEELARRFGPEQAMAVLTAAARTGR